MNTIQNQHMAAVKAGIKLTLASVKVEDVFQTRFATVLKNGNIHTVDVLLGKSDAALLKLGGFGKKMLREVAEVCDGLGICRPPFYDEWPWSAIRHELEKAGYTDGAIGLFREMLPKSGLAGMRRREEESQ